MKEKYSRSSKLLLLNSFVVTITIFILNPYLVIGGSLSLNIPDSDIAFLLMVSLIFGSIVSLALGLSTRRRHFTSILILASIGFVLAFFMLVLSSKVHGSEKLIFLIALILLRSSTACATVFTRAIHFTTNQHVNCSHLFAQAVTVFGIGSALGPILGGVVYRYYGFNNLLLLSMIFSLMSLLIVLFASPIIRHDVVKTTIITDRKNSLDYKQLIKTWPLMLTSILFFCMLGQSLSFIPVQISRQGSMSLVSAFFSVNAIILFVLPIPLNKYLRMKKISPISNCTVGLIAITLSMILVPFMSHSFIGVIIFTLLYSVGEVLFSTYSIEVLKNTVNVDVATSAVTLYTFLTTSIGIGLGQYIGILFYEFFNSLELVLVWSVILLIAVIIIKRINYEKSCSIISS